MDYWSDSLLFFSKVLSFFLLTFFVYVFIRKKIDGLNLCASAIIIFLTLWLNDGAFNRLNMGFIFGLICLARINKIYGITLLIINLAFQYAVYVYIFLIAGVKVAAYDYIMAAFFLSTYLAFLAAHSFSKNNRKIEIVQ